MTIQAVSNQPAATMAVATSAKSQQTSATTQPASATQSSSNTTTQASQSSASYTVSISNAGRAAMAEAVETSVQTAQEASKGDHQAQRLLAKEQAHKVA
ncbi:MAG TPA: hypothetical protein VL598_16330 [Trinickia sp.]|jgi:hypothetical protein|uniref:hypothetical protein n=1 Tax=Trinickia sp. TaxID=2571163 RepID=UPI002CF2444A|nr:hypothetical protein [Trinickia sp.]HTI19218.1 hypothetical protein [Trinickia sp.]